MISLFDIELKRMEDELRDLKTSHPRALGLIRFYQYTVNVDNVPSWTAFTVQAFVAEGESKAPLFVTFDHGVHLNYNYGLFEDGFYFGGGTVTQSDSYIITVLSSSAIDRFETTLTPIF